jgi:hypothetical protein
MRPKEHISDSRERTVPSAAYGGWDARPFPLLLPVHKTTHNQSLNVNMSLRLSLVSA